MASAWFFNSMRHEAREHRARERSLRKRYTGSLVESDALRLADLRARCAEVYEAELAANPQGPQPDSGDED